MTQKSHAVNRAQGASKEIKGIAVDNAKAVGETVSRVVSDAMEVAREKGADWMEGGRAAAEEIGEQVSDHVKEHAGSSLLIAALVGFLIGLLFCHRSND
jgi:ElaB/YqjD/DUF883 family membrane-anchored ribosome-binding protein